MGIPIYNTLSKRNYPELHKRTIHIVTIFVCYSKTGDNSARLNHGRGLVFAQPQELSEHFFFQD